VSARPHPAGGYEEPRSALTRPLLGWCLAAPAAAELTCLLLAVTVSPDWLIAMGMLWLFFPFLVAVGFLYRNWPTGIRIDDTGITVGAIRSHRAASRKPTVYHQSWGVYTCPWAAASNTRVITDPGELRSLIRHHYTFNNRWGGTRAMTHCDIGVLIAPFMRAALVVDVFPPHVSGTTVRPSRIFTNFSDGRLSRKIPPRMSPTWVIPTRQPQALGEALKPYQQMVNASPTSISGE
jgi:hypothetical protein